MNIEDTDPWLMAGDGLVRDLKFAKAEREGRVETLDGLYAFGPDIEGHEKVGSREDMTAITAAAQAHWDAEARGDAVLAQAFRDMVDSGEIVVDDSDYADWGDE